MLKQENALFCFKKDTENGNVYSRVIFDKEEATFMSIKFRASKNIACMNFSLIYDTKQHRYIYNKEDIINETFHNSMFYHDNSTNVNGLWSTVFHVCKLFSVINDSRKVVGLEVAENFEEYISLCDKYITYQAEEIAQIEVFNKVYMVVDYTDIADTAELVRNDFTTIFD